MNKLCQLESNNTSCNLTYRNWIYISLVFIVGYLFARFSIVHYFKKTEVKFIIMTTLKIWDNSLLERLIPKHDPSIQLNLLEPEHKKKSENMESA